MSKKRQLPLTKLPTGKPQVTPANHWVRRIFDPVFVALVVVAVLGTIAGILRAAGDGEGEQSFTLALIMIACALPVTWSVLRGLWHRDPTLDPITSAFMRTMIAPLITALPTTIAACTAVLLNPVKDVIVAATRPDGWHAFFAADDMPAIVMAFLFGGLVPLLVAMLVGLVLVIIVVLPWMALYKPKEAAEANLLDVSEESLKTNTAAIRGLAVLLVLVVATPGLIIVGRKQSTADSLQQAFANCLLILDAPSRYWADMAWVIGILLIPVCVALTAYVYFKQRPDHQARAATGTTALVDRKKI